MDRQLRAGCNALEELVQARLEALGVNPASMETLLKIPLDKYRDALNTSNTHRQRLKIGAVWPSRLVSVATSARDLDSALFRFAQHLRAAASDRYAPEGQGDALDTASVEAFAKLRSPPRDAVRGQPATELSVDAWHGALGIDRSGWLSRLDQIGEAIHRPGPRAKTRTVTGPIPSWLTPPTAERGSARLVQLAPWRPAPGPEVTDVAAASRSAYQAFVDRDFGAARDEIRAVEDGIGTTWAPTETKDGRAFFAWVRSVALVDLAYQSDGQVSGHHLLSAVELLHRVGEEHLTDLEDDLLDRLLVEPTGDHLADLDWAMLRYRLCRLLGHEEALDDLGNSTKVTLRTMWKQRHPDLRFTDETTVGMTTTLDEALSQILTDLQAQALDVGPAAERALTRLRRFCSADEGAALDAVLTALQSHLNSGEGLESMQILRTVTNLADQAADEVRECGSLLVQETTLPLLARISAAVAERVEGLSSAGGADLAARLVTDRLPLLHDAQDDVSVEILVRNEGTMSARNVRVVLKGDTVVQFPPIAALVGDIPAGGERTMSVLATTTRAADSASFTCSVSWDDDYDRESERTQEFFAEAERGSKWTATDRNPFQLGSIEDPERLIGREEYLQQYLDLARSGGSMYVTGLKRVGKTSLVRVALTLLERERLLGVYLPLGRALGPDPSAADLVVSMLEKLQDAAISALPGVEIPELDTAGSANFSRLADRWLSKVRRVLPPGMTAMIALDDFDELPEALRSGDEGDALFLFLRTLIDENWIAVTFIGSEVLPTLLAQQSQRLNQVDPIQVQNFGSRESTGDLLRRPSADRIDWTEEAVDAIHALTEGNPYYATILGGRVWTALRERDRTLAQVSDVEAASERLAATENQSHFMHLWSDDPEGLDSASPKAIRSSAVLRAVARCSTTPGALIDRDEVVAVSQQWIPGSTVELLQEACSSLVRRGIVQETDTGQLRLRLPVVGAWLLGAGGRHLDELYRESSLARPAANVVTAADYRRLARGLTYQSRPISAVDLQGWVEQLTDPTHQYLAFKILQRACTVGYFSQHRVQTEIVPVLTRKLSEGPLLGRERRASNHYLTSVLVLDSGPTGSSSPSLIRQMLASLRIAKAAVAPMDEIAARTVAERPTVILVMDDFAGSGRQMHGVLSRLVDELRQADAAWADQTTVAVGIGLAPGDGAVEALREFPCEVVVGLTLGHEVQAFHELANLFDSEADRIAARDLMSTIGRSLSAKPPLGFADQGLLVVLESNCPNNSLPALWKNGTYSGRDWLPLFERMEGRDRGATTNA